MTLQRQNKAVSNALAIVIGAGVLTCAMAARADVTVVTETITTADVSGASRESLAEMGDFTKPVLITVSYSKGNLSRFDTQDRIILRGLKEGTIDILNPGDRTYYVTTESEEFARTNFSGSMMSIGGGQGEIRSSPEFKQLDEARPILGMQAYGTKFAFRIDFKFPQDATQVPDMFYATVSVEGWSSTSAPRVPGDVRRQDMLSSLPKEIRSGLATLDDNHKGPILSSVLTFKMEAAYRERHIKLEILRHQDICSISREPLSDDLFRVPDGYQLVPTPAGNAATEAKPQTNDLGTAPDVAGHTRGAPEN